MQHKQKVQKEQNNYFICLYILLYIFHISFNCFFSVAHVTHSGLDDSMQLF